MAPFNEHVLSVYRMPGAPWAPGRKPSHGPQWWKQTEKDHRQRRMLCESLSQVAMIGRIQGQEDPQAGSADPPARASNRLPPAQGEQQVGPGAGVQVGGAHLRRPRRTPPGVERAALGTPGGREGAQSGGSGPAKRTRGRGQPGLRPGREQGEKARG